MTSSAEAGADRRVEVMVGPPYLYRGAQVCGTRTSRTCIFLLACFGAACCMIGLVFFTADLSMKSGMWAAGVVLMALGVLLLMWFLTLCCAARKSFNALPPSHPARTKLPGRPVMHPVATSTPAYQLLPLTHHTRGRPLRHSYAAGQSDGYRDQARDFMAGQNVGYMDQTGSYMGGQADGCLPGQDTSYSSGQGSYNGTWSFPQRKSGYSSPLTAGYGPEQTPGNPAFQTWDYRLGRAQRYPLDGGSSWGSLARHSDRSSLHHEFLPSTHTGTYGPEHTQGILLPGAGHAEYSAGHIMRGTLDQRQSKPLDHPPPYCDIIPHQ